MRNGLGKLAKNFDSGHYFKSEPVITYDHIEEQTTETKMNTTTHSISISKWIYFILEETAIAGLLTLCVWMSL